MRPGWRLSTALVAVLTLVTFMTGAGRVSAEGAAAEARAPRAAIDEAYGRLPLSFEENRGQAAPETRFLARTEGGAVFVTPTGLLLADGAAAVRLTFAGGASQPAMQALEPLSGRVNYYVGRDPTRWHENVPTFGRVRYTGVYPGIDVVVYGNQRRLEYDFVVAPGADPAAVTLRLDGADPLRLDAGGGLVIRGGQRPIVQQAPVAYQERDGRRHPVPARYVIRAGGSVGLALGAYDRTRPLVIDPVIVYAARIGVGIGRKVAVDSAGNAWVTGENASAAGAGYPTVNPLFAHQSAGFEDIVVTKLNPAGTTLLFSTFIGSGGRDAVHGLGVDAAGNAYIAGATHNDFPTTPGAFQPTAIGGAEPTTPFVAKLSPTGALLYSTFLSGTTFDGDPVRGNNCFTGSANGLAVDGAGNAYVTGTTLTNNVPTTPGAYKSAPAPPPAGSTCSSGGGAWLTKLAPDGASLVYSTYLEGAGAAVGLASVGVWVSGVIPGPVPFTVVSAAPSGATTGGALVRVDANGAPTRGTIIGPVADSLSIGPDGSAYVSGASSGSDFAIVNAFQPTPAGPSDGWAGRFPADGLAWTWSSYLGGGPATGISAASDASAWIAAWSGSAGFPIVNPVRPRSAGPTDAMLMQVGAAGALLLSTPLTQGHAYGLAIDGAGAVYVTGDAGADIAGTPGAYIAPSSGQDLFVMKLRPDTTAPTVAITSPPSGVWTGNSIDIAASASDDSGLARIELWGNGTKFGTIACGGTSCSGTVTWITGALAPAAYEVQARAVDTGGNATLSTAVKIFKDATSPVIASGAPAGTGGGGGSLPPLTASITAPANGATVSGDVSVGMAWSGASGGVQVTLKVDNANVLFSGNPSGTTTSTPWSTAEFPNGSHTLNLTVSDGAGRTATAAVTVTVSNTGGTTGDTQKPAVALTSPTNGAWTGNSIVVGATASDNVAVANIKLWANGGVIGTIACGGATCGGSVTWITGGLPPGAYEINAVATDTAGNAAVSTTVTINKDATSPVYTSGASTTSAALAAAITQPANGATVSGSVGVSLSATGVTPGSTLTYTFKLDGVTATTVTNACNQSSCVSVWNWDSTKVAGGTHTLSGTVSDTGGHTANAPGVTVTVSNGTGSGDTTVPSVVITSPPNGAWTGNSITPRASASDNVGVATLTFYGDGAQIGSPWNCGGTPTCVGEQLWITNSLAPGPHTITVVAKDTSGNQATSAPVVINR